MITVACVLKSGGVYTPEWVAKLQRGVARHLSIPHRFVCLSDVDVPATIERTPLVGEWETDTRYADNGWTIRSGWWSKLELFRPGLFDGLVLYLDLDTIVTGSLDAIVSQPHRFTMVADPWGRNGPKCSAVMAWQGDYSFLFDAFLKDPVGIAYHYDEVEPVSGRIGDQAFIEDRMQVDTFPHGTIASYKCDKLQSAPPENAAAVMFHGEPKMHQIEDGWVAAAWN